MLKILCFDDALEDAILIRERLQRDGLSFQLDHVISESEYRGRLESGAYDLILSDYNLPGFNGIAALMIAKKICPSVPFICVSGIIGDDLAVELMQLGASDYILKDRLSKLPVAIERAIREAQVQKARLEAETELKASKEKYQRLVEEINDVIYEIDSNGIITYISPSVYGITGSHDTYFTGKPFFDLIYVQDINVVKKKFENIIYHGSINPFEFRIQKQSGELIWLRTSSKPILIEGKISGIRGSAIDITTRKYAEEEIRNMKESLELLNQRLNDIREDERAAIAREIHDQLGQSLTALKIDADWLSANLPFNSKEGMKVREMVEGLTAMIIDIQRISSELRPAILDDLGLCPAMEWYIMEFEKRTGINCIMILDDIQFTDEKKNLVMYRILQEALTNVTRHSDAKDVKVNLLKTIDSIVMEVIDNGRGLEKEKIFSFKSLGFIGIRERLKQHNGILDIQSTLNKETRLSVIIPFI
jgi:two-component system, NarL family, sensor histidine kinase UhpB